MNKLATLLLASLLVTPGYAQKNLTPALQRALALKTQVPLPVEVLSKQTNQAAYQKLQGIFRPLSLTQIQAAKASLSPSQQRQVFKVHRGPSPARHSASAFALEIDGHVWGISAAHVINNIKTAPYMTVTTTQGKFITAPISTLYTSNQKGTDVSVFEIPPQLLPHLDALQPAPLPQPRTLTQSPCFVGGIPFYLPAEEVLFAGPHRILLRDQAHRDISGYCGSPVLTQGKVAAIHIGAYSSQDVHLSNWFGLLRKVSPQTPPPLHVAVPVSAAIQLARNATTNSGQTAATAFYVMGKQIGVLSPHEYIFSVQLLRGGRLEQTWHAHPFMDFNKLEEFFDLKAQDVLRITVLSPRTMTSQRTIRFYDVNVSTGEVTLPLESSTF